MQKDVDKCILPEYDIRNKLKINMITTLNPLNTLITERLHIDFSVISKKTTITFFVNHLAKMSWLQKAALR